MPARSLIGEKILQLKGDMSFRELSDAIYAKTGSRIGFTALSKLATGKRDGSRRETLEVIAKYANRFISWFYEDETIAEPRTKYLAPTGGPRQHRTRREHLDMVVKAARKGTAKQLEVLATLAEMIINDNGERGD